MRILFFTAVALFTVIGGAMAADSSADGDWHLISRFARPDASLALGTAAMDGGTGNAFYVRTTGEDERLRAGLMQRVIPLQAWRGQRLRVALRLKNEGDARAYAFVQVNKRNNTALRIMPQENTRDAAWQDHQFVLDVPANATGLVVAVGFDGNGGGWVDGITLEAANADAPVARTVRLDLPIVLPATPRDLAQANTRRDFWYGPNGCYRNDCYYETGNSDSSWGYNPPTSKAWSDPPPRR